MMRTGLLLSGLLLTTAVAYAAQDLDALLLEVQRQQNASAQISKERESRFLSDRNERARVLAESQTQLRTLEGQVAARRAQFDATAREIQQLQDELKTKAGDLNQLTAVVRQAAVELKEYDGEMVLAAQFPSRTKTLTALAEAKTLPGTRELDQLWFLLQQAMTESGKVARFNAPVMAVDGQTKSRKITRVGPFAVVSEGEFLRYLPASGKFQVLLRQPDAQVEAGELEAASGDDPVPMLIDPARGALFDLLTQRPEFGDRLQQGGLVGYLIMVLGVLGVGIALWQFWVLRVNSRAVEQQLAALQSPDKNNPLGRVLQVYNPREALDIETLELKLDEAILRETPPLERGLGLIKLLSGVAPLLGLLGTVVGMIITFQVITEYGSGDPKLMANGISTALVTTVQGLVAAIPLLFLHSLLTARSRALIRVLDQQAAGLLARSLEGQKKVQSGAARV